MSTRKRRRFRNPVKRRLAWCPRHANDMALVREAIRAGIKLNPWPWGLVHALAQESGRLDIWGPAK